MPSITRRPPKSEEDRTAVRARLLATTQRLLTEGVGFTELGVQRIAAEAKVARSSFYMHFKDKSELLLQLAASFKQKSFDIVSRWQAGPDADWEGLARAYEEVIALYRENRALLGAINEAAAYDPAVRAYWNAQLSRFRTAMAERLRADQRDGLLGPDVDPEVAARVVVFGGFAVLSQHIADGDSAEDAAVARETALAHWHGTFRRPSPSTGR
ncbi:TetR/AcrR family transcriptional regulator [Nonomuraea terrae]|uniref:TetR/AcrR family transcriptional regulator n=1 Tax=Nonomuraea terrae TaxID=2530383 RepID=A0A4R4YTM3_9ACTN|nr:TetR/AcrR family transcriptional regulator [Nonomuraea terrae]TDD47619.1 TetR/AcrR family transcriptional regulator [Nonomuraea terrae]